MPNTKKKINPAAASLARLSAAKRFKTMTAKQRSEQGRMAVASRRDRQKPARWFGLVVLPTDFKWRGAAHAAEVLDAAHSHPEVVLWSSDRAEVVARSQQADLRERVTLIIEQSWDPRAFTIHREFKPDAEAQVRALRSLVDDAGEGGR